jgi:hypothetical protein
MIEYPNRIGGEPAADSKNNRISTKGRNALIVAPYSIRVTIENNQKDPSDGYLTLASGGESSSFSAPSGEQRGALAVVTSAGLHDWSAVANLRTIAGDGDKATLAVSVKLNTQAKKQETSRVSMTVRWRGETQSTPDFWLSSLDTKPFFLGDIIFDRTKLTLDIDTSKVASYKQGDVIEDDSGGDDDDDPKVFEVSAPNYWCVGGFTEAGRPKVGDYIWPKSELTGTRAEGESLAAAKERISLGKIVTVTSKKYLIPGEYSDTRIVGKKFWRDEENDIPDMGFRKHVLFAASAVPGIPSDVYAEHKVGWALFCELGPSDDPQVAAPTGQVYQWAGRNNDYANMEFAKLHNREQAPRLEESLTWQPRPAESDGWPDTRFVHVLESEYSSNGLRRVLNRTGRVIDNSIDVGRGEKWYEYKTTPIPGVAQDTVWLNGEQIPTSWPDFEYGFVNTYPNADRDGYYSECIDASSTPWIIYNGYRYAHFSYLGNLFDILSAPAWSLSPCDRTEETKEYNTLYSDYTIPVEEIAEGATLSVKGGEYDEDGDGDIDWVELYPVGEVSVVGEGTYSITSSRGSTYHNSSGGAAAETAECAECAVTV